MAHQSQENCVLSLVKIMHAGIWKERVRERSRGLVGERPRVGMSRAQGLIAEISGHRSGVCVGSIISGRGGDQCTDQ